MSTRARPDLAVYDREGRLALVVEVKAKRDSSPEWATQMRQNLCEYGLLEETRFFLLATPDYFYFWKDGDPKELVPPDYSAEAGILLAPYVERGGFALREISSYGLEMLVASWLQSLMIADSETQIANPQLRWLFDSGLYDAVRNGSFAAQTAQ